MVATQPSYSVWLLASLVCLWLSSITATTTATTTTTTEHHNFHDDEAKHMKSKYGLDDFDERSFFELHDVNHDGHLDTHELATIYDGDADDPTTHDIVDSLLHELDRDHDGLVSLDEFLNPANKDLEFDVEHGQSTTTGASSRDSQSSAPSSYANDRDRDQYRQADPSSAYRGASKQADPAAYFGTTHYRNIPLQFQV